VSWRVRVLASTATSAGYRLAGLTVDEVGNAGDAGERLATAAADADVGIILVEQRLLDRVPPAVRRAVDRRALPIIVPIPAPNWTHAKSDAESYIVELLRRAIGYRVRLQ
jgi:vacuolar-type H+-ATPase subunit F/Vma7